MVLVVDAMAACAARSLWQDANTFVEADGLDIDPGALRKRTDGEGLASLNRDRGHFGSPCTCSDYRSHLTIQIAAQREGTMAQESQAVFREAEQVDGGKMGLIAAGGVFGALATMSCCIMPLVLFALGISGAWIGN